MNDWLKNMASPTPQGKNAGDVKMGFTVDTADKPQGQGQVQTTAAQASTEELESGTIGGVKIYTRNKTTGDVKYYDSNGKEMDLGAITALQEQYALPPEFSQTGAERKGEIQTREAPYVTSGKEVFADGVKPEYVVERQEYSDGDSWTRTIPKSQYSLVKFLRGEKEDGSKEEVKESGSNEVKQK